MGDVDGVLGHVGEAKQYLKEGRLEEALAKAWEAIAADPSSGEAQFTLGAVLCKMGRFEEGSTALAAAVAANPRSTAARYNLALAYERSERWALALEAWEGLLHLEPANAQARGGLERVRAKLPSEPQASEPETESEEWDGFLAPDTGQTGQPSAGYAPWEVAGAGAAAQPMPPPPPPPPTSVTPQAAQPRVEKQYYQEGDTAEWSLENFIGIIVQPIQFLFWNCVVLCAGAALVGLVRPSTALGVPFGLLGVFCSATFLVVILLGVLLAAAGFYHVFVLMFGGRAGFPVTFRSLALASVPWVVSSLLGNLVRAIAPTLGVVGGIISLGGIVWSSVIVAIAFRELHEMPTAKAALASAIPTALAIVGIILSVAIAAAAVAASMVAGGGA